MSDAFRTGEASRMEQTLVFAATKGLLAWANLVAQRATLKAPVKTGRLARSINVGTVEQIDRYNFAIKIGTNVEYAAAQEYGSGIHSPNPADRRLIPIRARRKKALAFMWAGGPTNISAYDPESGLWFFKVVYHPGVPAHPYLRPAVEETRTEGPQLITMALIAGLSA